jgi:D-sedoheptulose 7-phosphate isomerase
MNWKEYKIFTLDAIKSLDIDNSIIDYFIGLSKTNANIYIIGNGGSSLIAQHFATDLINLNRLNLNFKAHSLNANNGIITAISNDLGYENIFSNQLKSLSTKDDVLISISSSGNSQNIINAIDYANNKGLTTISLVGFQGGKIKNKSKYCIHVKVNNYGIVETLHNLVIHYIINQIKEELC